MGKLESKIQREIILYLESIGAYVVRVVVASKGGKHDLIVCYEGRFYSLEVKQERAEVKENSLQGYNLRKVRDAGGIAAVVRSVEDVKETIASL